MSPTEGERLATIEQVLRDMRSDIDELRNIRTTDHHRLRSVESAVGLMVDAQKQARQGEERQYRRLEIKLQWLAISVTLAGVLIAATIAILHH